MLRRMLMLVCVFAVLAVAGTGQAEDSATPQEVIEKVNAAAELLAKEGEAGLEQFNDKNGPWVFKDTYVFVFDCKGQQSLVAHIMPSLIGKDLNSLKSPDGTNIGTVLCGAVIEQPEGAWGEYMWPKVSKGEKKFMRKISYMKKVPGQPYEVGAGIYNEDVSMEELNNMVK